MHQIKNPTPHELVALKLAQDLATFGADDRASTIRARVADGGIGDDLGLRSTLSAAGFSAEQIAQSIRRAHAEMNAAEPRETWRERAIHDADDNLTQRRC